MNDRAEEQSPRSAASILKLLYDITHEFSSTLDLAKVLGKVLTLTVQSLGAAKGTLFMLDEQGHVVKYILARQHLPPEEKEKVVAVVMDKGLAGWVYRHRQSVLIRDTEKDRRWHTFPNDQTVRSVMSAPLIRRGMMNGIITLQHPDPNSFKKTDLQLLTAIAQQAAAAIENARLFTQISGERDTVEAVLNGVRDAILVTQGEEHILKMANPAAVTLFGIQTQNAIGKPLSALSPPDNLLDQFDRAQLDRSREAIIQFPGERHFQVNFQDIPMVGTVAALHDITHFKELDAIKSEFVATVSHDLKNPLGTVLGYAWLLSDDPDLNQEQRQCAMSILNSVERMQHLVDSLLDLAKIEAGIDAEREVCSLRVIISDVWNEFDERARAKEIQFETRVPDELAQIQANRIRVSQAISNLVSNAIKYTPEGGHVSIQVEQQGDVVTVGVTDDGPGVSPGDQAKLFQKFSRVGGDEMRKVAGTGLGLAIVRSVAEAHMGRVWVESKPGEGSTFFFQLPVTDAGSLGDTASSTSSE